MKRIAMVLAVIWLLSLPLTAFAAAYEVTAVPGGKSVEVYGIRKSSKSYYEIVIGADGIDTVTLPSALSGAHETSPGFVEPPSKITICIARSFLFSFFILHVKMCYSSF